MLAVGLFVAFWMWVFKLMCYIIAFVACAAVLLFLYDLGKLMLQDLRKRFSYK